MSRVLLPLWFALLVLLACPAWGTAKEVPSLEQMAAQSVLIVRCKVEVAGEKLKYRVLETWKGEYSPDLFHIPPVAGYLYGEGFRRSSPIADPHEGKETLFFFTEHNQPADQGRKLTGHDYWLVVNNGKVVFTTTEPRTGSQKREVYALEDFKQAILAASGEKSAKPVP